MDELTIRGYVTPEDFGGDIQQALDYAAYADIRKVVLTGPCHAEQTVTIPAQTHLVMNDAVLYADLKCEKSSLWNFEQKNIYIQGSGRIVGDLYFYNARRVILEDLQIEGSLRFEYSRDLRAERCSVTDAIQVGQGCANAIFQNLTAGSFTVSNKVFCGEIVPAKEPDIKNIILRDSVMTAGSVRLIAGENSGMFNIQADHIQAPDTAVVIGEEGVVLPPERYFNLTFTDLNAPTPLTAYNAYKHAYIV